MFEHATGFSSRMGKSSFPKTNTQELCLRSFRFHFGGGNLAINSPHSRCGREGKKMIFDKQSAEIGVAPTINPTVVRSTQASLVGCGIVGINQETMAVSWGYYAHELKLIQERTHKQKFLCASVRSGATKRSESMKGRRGSPQALCSCQFHRVFFQTVQRVAQNKEQ